jgi:tyrosine-protein kinase Etk/Wzc
MQEIPKDQNLKIDYFIIFLAPLKHLKFVIITSSIILLIIVGIIIVSIKLPSEKSFLPNIYTSEAKIFIPYKDENQNIDINSLADIANSGLTFEKGIKKTQVIISILQTNTVLDGIINDIYLKKRQDINTKFQLKLVSRETIRSIIIKNTTLKKDDFTGFIYISYNDIDPLFAKDMIDGYLNMLNKITIDFALTQTAVKKRFIQDRLKEITLKLNQAKSDFIYFQQEYGMISPENEATQITNTVAFLRSQLINKEAELENYKRIHKLGVAEKTDLDYEVEDLRKKIIKLTKSSINTSEKNVIISKDTISELSSQYENLKKNVQNFEDINSSLLKELEITQIQEKSEGSFFQVLDPPEVPSKKSGPSRSMIAIQAFVIAFIFIISIVILKELISELKNNLIYKEKIEKIKFYLSNKKNK